MLKEQHFSQKNRERLGGKASLVVVLLLLELFTSNSVRAAASTTLLGITKEEEKSLPIRTGTQLKKSNSRIFIKLSAAANYSIKKSGARMDIFFQKSSVASAFRNLEGDDILTNSNLKKSGENILLSLVYKKDIGSFNSYYLIEQQTKYKAGEAPPATDHIQLVLDIELLLEAGATRPRMVSGEARSQLNERPSLSQYASFWPDFFIKYEAAVPLRSIADFSPPPFGLLPPARAGEQRFLDEALKAGRNGELDKALQHVNALTGTKLTWEQQEALKVLKTEIIVRQKIDMNAARLFSPEAEKMRQPALIGTMRYLKALFHANAGDFPLAIAYLRHDKEGIAKAGHLAFHARILEAELLLAVGHAKKALSSLQGWESKNPDEERLRKLRLATALATTGDDAQALPLFVSAAKEDMPRLGGSPSAAASYALLLQRKGGFEEASRLFALTALVQENDATQRAMTLWRQASALLRRGGDQDEARKILRQASQTAPGSEGSDRARLKTNDLAAYMATTITRQSDQDIAWLLGVNVKAIRKDATVYEQEYKKKLAAIRAEYLSLAQGSLVRDIREEAWFKQALYSHLTGDSSAAVKLLGEFFKNFRKAGVMEYALALQAQILPQIIKDLAHDRDYIKAVTLAEKNREILMSRNQNFDYLLDIARSFDSLGLYERAARIYRFLFNTAATVEETSAYYLPFASSCLQSGDGETLQKLVDDYVLHFPAGPERQHLVSFLLRFLEERGRLKDAMLLIDGERAPYDSPFVVVATRIFWKEKRQDKIVTLWEGMELQKKNAAPSETIALYGEALLNTGNLETAQNAFGLLLAQPEFREQALFRLAGIHIKKGAKDQAVKLLLELTDKGKSRQWKRLAQEELFLLESQLPQPVPTGEKRP